MKGKHFVRKLSFLVLLFCSAIIFTGCSVPESTINSIVEKYDPRPAATTLPDETISKSIVGRWQLTEGYFDRSLGMSIVSEEYEHQASGTWKSEAVAVDAVNSIDYRFTVSGKWLITNKQLVVTEAVQSTRSINRQTNKESEYEDKAVPGLRETVNDINENVLTTIRPDATIQRIYRRKAEPAEQS